MKSPSDPALLRAFASEVKARRTLLDLSQEGLAFAAGLNRTFVARLEVANTSPSLGSIFALAKALQVEPGELIASIAKRYRKELRLASQLTKTSV